MWPGHPQVQKPTNCHYCPRTSPGEKATSSQSPNPKDLSVTDVLITSHFRQVAPSPKRLRFTFKAKISKSVVCYLEMDCLPQGRSCVLRIFWCQRFDPNRRRHSSVVGILTGFEWAKNTWPQPETCPYQHLHCRQQEAQRETCRIRLERHMSKRAYGLIVLQGKCAINCKRGEEWQVAKAPWACFSK